MPAPIDPKLPLRLAYSHREKAEVAIRQCDRSLQDGGVDTEHHTKLRAVYERELHQAQRTIDRLLGIEKARMESLEAQRRAALEEQLHLPERVTAGKISARDANDANRRLTQRLTELDAQIAVCRSRMESRTSEELGGFIDLSFSEYAAEEVRPIDAARQDATRDRSSLRDWYITSIVALIAAIAVFLPWFGKDGVTSSLITADGALVQLAAQAGLHAGIARFVWVPFAVTPFLGVLMTAGRNVKMFGWGFLLLGLVMLACAAFPGLVLGAGASESASIFYLLSSFRVGALLYCASAVGLIVLGAFRVSPPGDSLRHAIAVSLALLGAFGAIGLLAAVALLGVQGLAKVEFSATLDTTTNDRIVFSIANGGRDPVACFFPLPPDARSVTSLTNPSHTFGVHVGVRERGRDVFSTLPPSSRVWSFAQGPLPEDMQVLVNAGSVLKGNLDLRQLSAVGVDPVAVRIELVALDGSLIEQSEVVLDERYLSAPGPIRDPLIITPPPARPGPSAPGAAADATPSAPAEGRQQGLNVEFVGAVAGRAIIRVYSPDGSTYEEAVAGPGELVAGEWTVESLVRQPSSVNMKHVDTGAAVQVIRGNIVRIEPSPKS